MKTKFYCVIVEDEPLAQMVLEAHMKTFDDLVLAAKFFNAIEAFEFLASHKVDLMFIDIKMPGIKGTDFVKSLRNPPNFVFTTAFQEYAIEGFELDAIDYLLKPITIERFATCIDKFKRKLGYHSTGDADSISVKVNGFSTKLLLKELLFAESKKDYIKFYLEEGSLIAHMTMKTLEAMLPTDQFVRVHRSYIVNRLKIDQQNRQLLVIGKKEIPIGDLYRNRIRLKGKKWG